MNSTIFKQLIEKINKAETLSPCLFLGNNLELNNNEIKNLALELLKHYEIPSEYLYTLEDTGEKIKISEIKDFIQIWNSLPGYKFQIFFIENVSRLTIQSSNSCLKFFEEPGVHNIIFLTNPSESGIMDTILSRVQTFYLWWNQLNKENNYFQSLLSQISQWNKNEAISYFFSLKWEKQEYIQFLENIIIFAKKHLKYIEFLNEVEEDIIGIQQNNVNGRYVIDKYLLKL